MYFYVFTFRDFEQGLIVARRVPASAAGPPTSGDWVATARDDAHAIALARQAALKQWPEPKTRGRLDFVVTFEPA